jgi:F-type H+-transporting ATPase subunit b
MPQLDFSTYASQLFWLLVTFVLLYFLMRRLALPRVDRAIGARRSRIETDLGEAEQLKREAETVLAAYQKSLSDARAQAQATLRMTIEQAAAEAAERQRRFAAELAAETEAAERQIAAAKERALADIRNVAVEAAGAVSEKLVGAPAEAAALAAAVDRALRERAH